MRRPTWIQSIAENFSNRPRQLLRRPGVAVRIGEPSHSDTATEIRDRLDLGRSDGFRVATYSTLSVDPDPRIARSRVAAAVATQLREGTPNVAAHPRFEELRERADDGGLDALVDAPADDWHELGAGGTLEDAITHVALMDEAGVDDVALFPAPDVRVARTQLDTVRRIAAALR